ncbi:MAG: helical backbone metal receptor [Lentisphaeraceae bacterium]|nr:helical backbone metal receptor [Lentisphaeraceae bacterium]
MKVFLTVFFLTFTVFSADKTQRVISLAPSLTEILCALDLQENIVGVTDFCKDPYKQTDFSKLRVGGIINPNFEKMLKSKPSVVFTLKSKGNKTLKLNSYGMKVVTLNHINLDGVFNSILVIGKECGIEEKAQALHDRLKALLVEKDFSNGKKVLVTISRLSSQSNIRLWVAGNDGFYSRLLNLCGAQNILQENEKFTQVSIESIIKMNPDVIILLRDKMTDEEKEQEINFWKKLPSLKAVSEGSFHIITGDEIMIPGPRFPSVLKKFQAVPE